MKVSAIICTKNRKRDFSNCLLSLLDQRELPDELVVVENIEQHKYLSQKRLEALVSAQFPCRYFSTTKANIAGSRNLALTKASGDILLYVDDDVVLDRSVIATLKALHSKHPKALGFVGRIYPVRNDVFSRFSYVYFNNVTLTKQKIFKVNKYSMSTISLKRKPLLKSGLFFDHQLDCGEDVDLLLRLERKRLAVYFSPAIITRHRFETNIWRFCAKQYHYGQGYWKLNQKHHQRYSISDYRLNQNTPLPILALLLISLRQTKRYCRQYGLGKSLYLPALLHFLAVTWGIHSQDKSLLYTTDQ